MFCEILAAITTEENVSKKGILKKGAEGKKKEIILQQ